MSLITAINKLDYIICCNFHFKPCSFLSKFLAPYLNWQISVSMAFFDNFAGIEFLINALKGMQMLSGSISITHASNEPLACIELVTELFQLWFWDISLTFFSGEVWFDLCHLEIVVLEISPLRPSWPYLQTNLSKRGSILSMGLKTFMTKLWSTSTLWRSFRNSFTHLLTIGNMVQLLVVLPFWLQRILFPTDKIVEAVN